MKIRHIKADLFKEIEANGYVKNKYNQWWKKPSSDIIRVWNTETVRESYEEAALYCQLEISSTVLMSYFDNLPDSFILTFFQLSPVDFGLKFDNLLISHLESNPTMSQTLLALMKDMEAFAESMVNTHDLLSVIDSKRFGSRITKVQMDFFHGKVSGDSFYAQFPSWSSYSKYLAERENR